jgi:hypothetical protein
MADARELGRIVDPAALSGQHGAGGHGRKQDAGDDEQGAAPARAAVRKAGPSRPHRLELRQDAGRRGGIDAARVGAELLLQTLQPECQGLAGDPEADGELVGSEPASDVEVEQGIVLGREGGG